jgi:hypothetical protein
VGEIDNRAIDIGIGHGGFVLRDQQQRQRQTTAYRKCLPLDHRKINARKISDAPKGAIAS